MTQTIRADHIGSLLRPPELLDAREQYQQGSLPAEQLRQVEESAILDALAMQKQVGIDVFSDGEYRRADFMRGLVDAVEGFVAASPAPLEWHSPSGVEKETRPGMAVGGKLRPRRRLTAHEAHFLAEPLQDHHSQRHVVGTEQLPTRYYGQVLCHSCCSHV